MRVPLSSHTATRTERARQSLRSQPSEKSGRHLSSQPARPSRRYEHVAASGWISNQASIARLDNHGRRDVVERTTVCGPFRSADDFEPGYASPQYSCNLAVFLDHPEMEQGIQYDVEV